MFWTNYNTILTSSVNGCIIHNKNCLLSLYIWVCPNSYTTFFKSHPNIGHTKQNKTKKEQQTQEPIYCYSVIPKAKHSILFLIHFCWDTTANVLEEHKIKSLWNVVMGTEVLVIKRQCQLYEIWFSMAETNAVSEIRTIPASFESRLFIKKMKIHIYAHLKILLNESAMKNKSAMLSVCFKRQTHI